MKKAKVFFFIFIFAACFISPKFHFQPLIFPVKSFAAQKDRNPDINWFKDQLNVFPKYQEKETGIFGFSWAHFLTMIFMGCFLVLGLVFAFLRYKRTKELLKYIEQEVQKDARG